MTVIALAVGGCVAPPMGLGRGALVGPHPTTASIGTAALDDPSPPAAAALPRTTERQTDTSARGPQRQVVQLDASFTRSHEGTFSDDIGAALTYLHDTRGHFSGLGLLPYWRPRWELGHLSVATALSAAILGAGEGGMLAAFVDTQLGYGTRDWSVYAGGYAHGCMVADGGPLVASGQVRAGAEITLDLGARIGIAVELYRQLDAINVVDGDGSPTFTSNLRGAGLKLRLELP